MIKNKYIMVCLMLAAILLAGILFIKIVNVGMSSSDNEGNDEFLVVTSFYPMYVAAENITDQTEGLRLENLSEPQTGCMHDYQLTTRDMKLLSLADVFVVNGGGIESFLSEVASQYPDLIIIDASDNIELSEDNAHAWMDPERYNKQVMNICRGLISADDNRVRQEQYQENADIYMEKVNQLVELSHEIKNRAGSNKVVLLHEAYEYLAEAVGCRISGTMDLDEERQISAGEVSDMLDIISRDGVGLVFAEKLYGKDMAETLAKEADVKVLYLDTLVRGDYSADSYLEGMRQNLLSIKDYLND